MTNLFSCTLELYKTVSCLMVVVNLQEGNSQKALLPLVFYLPWILLEQNAHVGEDVEPLQEH